jgi:hypothetical protein
MVGATATAHRREQLEFSRTGGITQVASPRG